MIKAIIIDDEMNGIKSLELLITKFIPDIKLIAYSTDPMEAVNLINNKKPDLVFLDINMPSMNGFELLERLEFKNFRLIFTTAHQEYAIRAIRESATDYLLKPIDIDELQQTIVRVREKILQDSSDQNIQQVLNRIVGAKNIRVPLPNKLGIEYVSPSMIIYIEANSNGSKVALTNMTVMEVIKPLKEYETLLCVEGLYFLRIHNSFLINLNYVNTYVKEDGGYAVMSGNRRIPISKLRKTEFLKAFNLDA